MDAHDTMHEIRKSPEPMTEMETLVARHVTRLIAEVYETPIRELNEAGRSVLALAINVISKVIAGDHTTVQALRDTHICVHGSGA